jgi:acyl carrier protein
MKKRIIKILNDIRPEFDFSSGDDFINQGMLDSFDTVRLVVELDEEFGISIDGVDIVPDNFKNVDTISRLLIRNGAKP